MEAQDSSLPVPERAVAHQDQRCHEACYGSSDPCDMSQGFHSHGPQIPEQESHGKKLQPQKKHQYPDRGVFTILK